jgi:hypothetical protein
VRQPRLRCARAQRHPAWIVQFTAGGPSHCRSVSKAKYEALAYWVEQRLVVADQSRDANVAPS